MKIIKMNYYRMILKKRHSVYWMEDNLKERVHLSIDRLSEALWGLYFKLMDRRYYG